MPISNEIEINVEPVDERLNHAQCLREDEQPATIEAIGDRAAESAQKQPGNTVEEADNAQQKSGTGQVPNEPALGDVLHEIAGVRKQGPYDQEAKVPMPQGTQGLKSLKALHVTASRIEEAKLYCYGIIYRDAKHCSEFQSC